MQPLAMDLRDRVLALGRAHDFVRPHSDASRPEKNQSSLHGMIGELLAPYRERIMIEGEDLSIDDRSATPLALLFHELATNAAKYGALSVHDGVVLISTRPDDNAACLSWTERGGPAVKPPQEEGFGTKLMELSVARQMSGQIERDWASDGLVVSLTIPVASMYRDQRPIRGE